MDPDSSPYIIPNIDPHDPFPHYLLSTRELWLSLDPYVKVGYWYSRGSKWSSAFPVPKGFVSFWSMLRLVLISIPPILGHCYFWCPGMGPTAYD